MNRALFAICSIVFLMMSSISSAQVSNRSISVSGDAVVWAVPDEVIVNVGIETFDGNLDAAKSKNDVAMQRLLAAIKELKVDEKQIQTADLEFEIHYRNGSHPSEGIEGYFARRMFSVTLKDIKQFEPLVDTSLKNGANRLMGFEYRTTELRKYRDQARTMAARAAKEKASLLAKELDCEVGKPVSISEGYFGYVGGWNARWGWNNNVNSYVQAQNSIQSPGEGETGENMPLGQIGIRAQVSVNFDLK
ncbi:MAG TPA: SIMPL domain-containing protein [Tepidisphaeraceae bacterium]|nr:SIMPL domain-containing protein [Tepidisphaeraceae bacterium]